jgi:hypothetical protein
MAWHLNRALIYGNPSPTSRKKTGMKMFFSSTFSTPATLSPPNKQTAPMEEAPPIKIEEVGVGAGALVKKEPGEHLQVYEISWKDKTILASEDAVRLEWTTLHEQFLEILGPFLHSRLQRQQSTLPIKCSMPVWGLLGTLLQHRMGQEMRLSTQDQIRNFLLVWEKKMHARLSYSVITPPFVLRFNVVKNQIKIEMHCVVYNAANVRQWPLNF